MHYTPHHNAHVQSCPSGLHLEEAPCEVFRIPTWHTKNSERKFKEEKKVAKDKVGKSAERLRRARTGIETLCIGSC